MGGIGSGPQRHPPATIDLVYALWETGLSASKIAIELQKDGLALTRNAVIGICHRNRDRFIMRTPQNGNRRAKVTRHAGAIALAGLADGCAWPIGDPGEPGFHFCGAERHVRASSYCEAHAAAARAPKPPPPEHGRHPSGEGKPWRA